MLCYDDQIEFEFNETGHRYTVRKAVGDKWTEKEPVVGVSTILSILSKDFLAPWAAKLATEYMVEQLRVTKSLKGLPALALEAKNQHRVVADKGKKAGHVGHALVEALAQGKKVILPSDPEAHAMAESVQKAYEAFSEDYPMEVLANEKSVYSRTHHYAGTYDRKAIINGKLTVIDWKTTNTSKYNPDGLYAEYFGQGGAYAIADEDMYGEPIEQIMIVNLPKDGGEYKVKTLDDLGLTMLDAKLYFLAAKQLYDINQLFQWRMTK